MFSVRSVASSPPLASHAPRRTRRAGAGPRRFSALWPELRLQLMDARRRAAFPWDETPEPPPRMCAGGDA